MDENLIGKYIVDKRNTTSGDVGQIIDIKHCVYYLIKWVRIEKELGISHGVGGYAMYSQRRLEENFSIVDNLSEAMFEIL